MNGGRADRSGTGTLESPAHAVHGFADSERFGRRLARALRLPWFPVHLHRFPDGEGLPRVHTPPGSHAILVRSLYDPDAKLVQTVLAADALRRAGARRVTLVAPYLPYMRQDAVFQPGEPISQRVVGQCLRRAVGRVLTVEAHLHRIPRLNTVMGRGSRSLSAASVIAERLRRGRGECVIVGPDQESEPWVRAIAGIAGAEWLVGRKERRSDRTVHVEFPRVPSRSRAVLVDDVASSGATLAAAARTLHRLGARVIDAVVVHAIFAPGALARIRRAGVRAIVSCDTIPHPTNGISTVPTVAQDLAKEL